MLSNPSRCLVFVFFFGSLAAAHAQQNQKIYECLAQGDWFEEKDAVISVGSKPEVVVLDCTPVRGWGTTQIKCSHDIKPPKKLKTLLFDNEGDLVGRWEKSGYYPCSNKEEKPLAPPAPPRFAPVASACTEIKGAPAASQKVQFDCITHFRGKLGTTSILCDAGPIDPPKQGPRRDANYCNFIFSPSHPEELTGTLCAGKEGPEYSECVAL